MDDEKDILSILKQGLEQNNYQVHDFHDPVEALKFTLSTHSPQMLITDIRMHSMSGFELARRVIMHNPDIMIVFLTSFEINRREFEIAFPSAKVDALLRKPVSIIRLVDTVNALFVSIYDR